MKTALSLATAALLLAGAGIANANTFAFTIVNKTNSIVETFYASPTGVSDWENDLFEEKALPPGQRLTVRFSDDRNVCQYDLLIEFRDKALEDLTDTQNLCELGEYEITE